MIDPKHTRYQGKGQPHEAGYDSLLTAKNFIKQAVQLPGPKSSQLPSKIEPQRNGPASVKLTRTQEAVIPKTTAAKNSRQEDITTAKPGSRFVHENVFATLSIDDTDLVTEFNALAVAEPNPELIPSFSSHIWKIYGNKLRVFGTEERVCDLNGEA